MSFSRQNIKVMLGSISTSMLMVCSVGAGSLTPPAGPPQPTMKRLDQISPARCISSLPFTISSSGKYEVCGNLQGSASEHGITIAASNVTLELAGFTLSGVDSSFDGIHVSDGSDNVTIRGGIISGWGGNGINAASSSEGRCVIEGTTVSSCLQSGIVISSGSVSDARVSLNSNNGVVVMCPDGTCRANSVILDRVNSSGNTGVGIQVLDGPPVFLESCVSSDNTSHGIQFLLNQNKSKATDHNSSRSNKTSSISNGGSGFDIDVKDGLFASFIFEDCVISRNGGVGVYARGESSEHVSLNFDKCEMNRNTQQGLRCENVVLDLSSSSCDQNGSHGMWLGYQSSAAKATDYNSSRSNRTTSASMNGNGGSGALVEDLDSGQASENPLAVDQLEWVESSAQDNALNGVHIIGSTSAKFYGGDISGNGDAGIRMTTSSSNSGLSKADAKRMTFSSNSSGALVCPDASGTVDVRITESVIEDSGADGLTITASPQATNFALLLDSSEVKRSKGNGITFDASPQAASPVPSQVMITNSSIRSNDGGGCVLTTSVCHFISSGSGDNGGGGLLCGDTDHFVSGGSGFTGNGGIGLDVQSVVTELTDVSCVSNTGDGALIDSTSFKISSSVFSSNTGQGLHCPDGSGTVRTCVISSNTVGGLRIDGSGVDISDNVVSGHQNAGSTGEGISVYGTGNRIQGNMTANNDRGTALYANGNPLYTGSSTGESVLYEDPGVSGNSSGTSPVRTATNPYSIIVH